MSPNTPVMINVPFGYAWTEAEEEEHAASQPPSGPPLLDNNESSILRNFFDDPNNVDPQFLALGPTFQDSGNLLPEFPPFGWETTPSVPGNDAKPFNAANLNQQPPSFNAFTAQSAPKDEDLFAANILRGGLNQTMPTVNGQHGFMAPPPPTTQQQQQQQQQQQHQRQQQQQASLKSPTSMPPPSTNFGGGQTTFDNTNTFQPRGAAAFRRASNTTNTEATGQPPTGPRQAPDTLNFGSDAGFRNHYAGSASFEAPDRELKSIVTEHFHPYPSAPQPLAKHGVSSSSGDTTPQTPAFKGKKRDMAIANDDEESSEEDEAGRPTKRKRSKVKEEHGDDDDEDDDDDNNDNEDDVHAGSRKGKKSSKKGPSSPGKRRKSSPGPAKVVRENLSEAQKRSNHIQSEQKRRNLIKQGFEDLTRMVPELRPGGLSKSNMLVEAAKFIRDLKENNEALKLRMDALNPG